MKKGLLIILGCFMVCFLCTKNVQAENYFKPLLLNDTISNLNLEDSSEKLNKLVESIGIVYKKYLDSLPSFEYKMSQKEGRITFEYNNNIVEVISNENKISILCDSISIDYNFDGIATLSWENTSATESAIDNIGFVLWHAFILEAVADYNGITIPAISFEETEEVSEKIGDFDKYGFEFVIETIEYSGDLDENFVGTISYVKSFKVNIDTFNISDFIQNEKENLTQEENTKLIENNPKVEEEEIENPQTGSFVPYLLLSVFTIIAFRIFAYVRNHNKIYKI